MGDENVSSTIIAMVILSDVFAAAISEVIQNSTCFYCEIALVDTMISCGVALKSEPHT